MTEEKRIKKEQLFDECTRIKDKYNYFMFATAVDYPEKNSLDIVYYLRSFDDKNTLIIKTEVPRKDAEIKSLTSIWPAAEWHEREIFDLFGVKFSGHPDLRRILLPENWEGHPLLKDYEKPGVIKKPETIK